MSLLSFLSRRPSAPLARERLQILLSHERTLVGGNGSDLVHRLREEIIEVIARHVQIDREKVVVKMDRGSAVSTLEVEIEIPAKASLKLAG